MTLNDLQKRISSLNTENKKLQEKIDKLEKAKEEHEALIIRIKGLYNNKDGYEKTNLFEGFTPCKGPEAKKLKEHADKLEDHEKNIRKTLKANKSTINTELNRLKEELRKNKNNITNYQGKINRKQYDVE